MAVYVYVPDRVLVGLIVFVVVLERKTLPNFVGWGLGDVFKIMLYIYINNKTVFCMFFNIFGAIIWRIDCCNHLNILCAYP